MVDKSLGEHIVESIKKELDDIELELYYLQTKKWTNILPPAQKQEKILNLMIKKIELEIQLNKIKA